MKALVFILFSLLHENFTSTQRDESKYEEFQEILNKSKNVLLLTGAGISVESNLPSFQGEGRFYRGYDSHQIAHPDTFEKSPSLVWEYYHYQRELVLSTTPNEAHTAIAEYELECNSTDRNFTLITQNIDGLHTAAGSKNVIELHGTLFRTKCTVCGDIQPNYDNPVCPAFNNKSFNPKSKRNSSEDIPASELPRCKKKNCNGLLRPDIVWFTEPLDPIVIARTEEALERADVFLVIGTSSTVLPAAEFPVTLARKGVPVAEFNKWSTLNTRHFRFHFRGSCTQTVPKILNKKRKRKYFIFNDTGVQ